MKITQTALPGVVVITRNVLQDSRGSFSEMFRENELQIAFVQDNISWSSYLTIRGLHYQLRHPQAKLVTCIMGRIYDVVVDIRRGSPTFGKYVVIELRAFENGGKQVFVPAGYAHGFIVREQAAIVHYKCSDYYDPDNAKGISWNDPELGIEWNIPSSETPRLSEKDTQNPRLENAELPKWEGNKS